MTCTIRDIAQAAGVSASTVSLVLRGKENRISEETKLRVRQIAKQMNYVPNQVAVSLVTKKTHTIGLIYADMLNPFYSELAVGVERNAQLHNYSLLICNCDEQVERCIHSIDLLEKPLYRRLYSSAPGNDQRQPQTAACTAGEIKYLPYSLCDSGSCDS